MNARPAVLVLDSNSVAGLEAIQSLGRNGADVHAAANVDCLAFVSRRVAMHWKQPPNSDGPAFVQWLRDLDSRFAYTLIVPSTEQSVRMFLSLSEEDPLYRKATIASRASLRIAVDKWATHELAVRCGVPTIRTRLITSMVDASRPESLPLVLKAAQSVVDLDGTLGVVRAHLARSVGERDRHCEYLLRYTPVIEQPFVEGHGVGIEMLYDKGRKLWHFCHLRLHEGTGQEGLGSGSLYRCSLEPPADLLKYATDMLDALEWHGVAMVEFLVSPAGEAWLMEINPRLWGSLALAIDAGVDFPVGLLHLAQGRNPPPQPRYRVPQFTRRMPEDLMWLAGKARSHPGWAMRESLLMSRVLVGRESWDHFDFGDLRITAAHSRRALQWIAKAIARVARDRLGWGSAQRLHRRNLQAIRGMPRTVRNVLFLCHGNICRSPVAAALARRSLQGCEVLSAGFVPSPGRQSPAHLQEAARSLGLDASTWRSLHVSRQMVEAADVIFIMDRRNLECFRDAYPDQLGKILFLGMLLAKPVEIADPYGESVERTLEILEVLGAATELIPGALRRRTTDPG